MNTLKNIFLPGLLILALLTINVDQILASDPPDPPGGGHGGGDLPPGGGAPIGGGTFILIALGAAYGGKKIYDSNKEELED